MKNIILSVSLLAMSVITHAEELIEFQVKTPAKASEVNANFWELEDRIKTTQENNFWKKYQNNIYYTGGNIGIGTNNPASLLHLEKPQNGITGLTVTNPDNSSLSGSIVAVGTQMNGGGGGLSNGGHIAYLSHSNTHFPDLAGYFDVLAASQSKGLILRTSANNGVIRFITKFDKERMTVTASGNIGIGITRPVSKLAVSGLPISPPDSSGNAGIVCSTNNGNFWLDNDGTADCK